MTMIVYLTGLHSRGAVLSLIPSSVEAQKIGMQVSLGCFGFGGNGAFRSRCPRFVWSWQASLWRMKKTEGRPQKGSWKGNFPLWSESAIVSAVGKLITDHSSLLGVDLMKL